MIDEPPKTPTQPAEPLGPTQANGEAAPASGQQQVTVVQRFRNSLQNSDESLIDAIVRVDGEDAVARPPRPLPLPSDSQRLSRSDVIKAIAGARSSGQGEATSADTLAEQINSKRFLGSIDVAEPLTEAEALCSLTSTPMLELSEEDGSTLPHEVPGRYDVAETIGVGGMGRVLRVADHSLRRNVAMKVLHSEFEAKPEYINALRREARILGGLEHPSIIPVHELGTRADGTTYYTMKLMPDLSLGEVIHRLHLGDRDFQDRYKLRKLVGIFVQIAQGLAYAHSRGVVHRDLKPENVLLGDIGEVQIMDWGIAKNLGSPRPDYAEGLVVGTPAYMSPEQAAGQDSLVDERSDIYALGVMLYEALALKRPYTGENSQQQLEATKNVVPMPPSVVARDRYVPPHLEALCMRMLEKKPDKRPQTMREVWEALDRYLAGELERERLQERADQCYERALQELANYEALRAEREFLVAEERDLCRSVRPWDTQSDKQQVWSLRHRLQMLEVQYAHAFSTASELLRQAIDQGEDHTRARERLVGLYWQRHDEAAEQGDNATKLFFARQAHELALHGAQRTGTVHIRSQPPGALIYAIPFDEIRGTMGKPSPQHELGCAPIASIELPLGPYVLMAHLDGHRDALETVYIREESRDILLLCYPWSSETPRIGREVELGRLWSLLEDAEVRSQPVTCLLSGELGMGKNGLLDAFRRQIEQHPTKLYFLLEVTCDRIRRDLPYSTVVDLMRVRAGILASDTGEVTRQKLRRMVASAFTRFGKRELSPERAAEADQVADAIGALPAFDSEEPSRMGLRDPRVHRSRRAITEALARYFQAVAVSSPVLMLIRNVQHADDSSRAFFKDLITIVRGSPILVVASSTEADEVEALQMSSLRRRVTREPTFLFEHRIYLTPLPDLAVTCLVREMLAAPASPELLSWILRHALGNSFLAGEIVHMLARLGAMSLQAAQWQLIPEKVPADMRPGDVECVLRNLIGTLPRHARIALSTAVVVGSEFWAGALRDLGVPLLSDALDQLVQTGFIVRNASSRYVGDREYRLSSVLRRRVAYDMLAPMERRILHRKVATWILRKGRTDLEEGLRLAHHLKMGGQPEEAALFFARIAKAALAANAEEEAERLYTHAHVLSGDPDMQGAIEVILRDLATKAHPT